MVVQITSSVTLEGIVAVVFNADKDGMQAAFAQSIIDSVGGLFEEIIEIEATEQRRRLQTTYSPTAAPTSMQDEEEDEEEEDVVEISYTGVARVDGTDGEAASADLLEQSMDAMTLAIYDGSFLATLQASDPAFSAVAVDVDATQAAIEAASYTFVFLTPGPTAAPTLGPTPRITFAGAAESSFDPPTNSSSSGSGTGPALASTHIILIAVGGAVLFLIMIGSAVTVWRREHARQQPKRPTDEAIDVELGSNEAALERHRDVTKVVATGMSLVNTLLTAGSLVPFVGDIAEVANEFFGSASEFGDKADDVVTAARRVVEVLQLVDLMTKNAASLIEGKEIVEARMRQLLELLQSFHAAVRAFGTRGWFKRMWTIREHVDSLSELDRDIKLQLEMFRDAYRLATDNVYLERTYRIEQAIERLVAERVQTTGESKATAVEALSKDAAAVETVGAHIPDKEFAAELREFHIELRADVKELLRRESSLKIRLSRSQQSMRQRLDHITELLEETTLRSPSATLTPVRQAVAYVDAAAPPPGSTLPADEGIHVAEAPVPAPLVEAPAPALDAAVPAPAPAPAEKD